MNYLIEVNRRHLSELADGLNVIRREIPSTPPSSYSLEQEEGTIVEKSENTVRGRDSDLRVLAGLCLICCAVLYLLCGV